jgi:Fe-S-cluster containining protein
MLKSMESPSLLEQDDETYDKIYAIDLIYSKDCWKLCGDGHCCHFSRYRGKTDTDGSITQTIPLLSGEYAYMQKRGYLGQYNLLEHKTETITIGECSWSMEFLAVRVKAGCPCKHDIRPTACRLYPLWPLFTPEEGLIGIVTKTTPFEVVEELGNLSRACAVQGTTFAEFGKFFEICNAIRGNPRVLFSAMIIQISVKLFEGTLRSTMESKKMDVFQAISYAAGQGQVIDTDTLSRGLVSRICGSVLAQVSRQADDIVR